MKHLPHIAGTLLGLVILLSSCASGGAGREEPTAMNNKVFGDPDSGSVTFGVMSDTHVAPGKAAEQERLGQAFRFFAAEHVDAAAVVGDLTDGGSPGEYALWKTIKDDNLGNSILVASMGNHEGDSADGFEHATGDLPNCNYVINGYHFITLSPGLGVLNESSARATRHGGGDYGYLRGWLKRQLDAAVAEDPAKPIFVFFHHPIFHTFYVSDEWNGSGLELMFNGYPQVVSFSGHIHSPNNDPLSIWQDGGFTAVNTVSLSYFELESGMVYGTVPPQAHRCAQVLSVEARGSVVTIRNFDLISNSWIPQTWTFDVSKPASFPYTNARAAQAKAPVFPASAKVEVSSIDTHGAEMRFDQAEMEPNDLGDIVHSYRIDLVEADKRRVVRSFKIWSEFYFIPMPTELRYSLEKLDPATNYELHVFAMDAWGKTSKSSLSTTFRTRRE